MTISNTVERRSEAEHLITEIVGALCLTGEYVAHMDLRPVQRIVDFSWAARQAGRRLGIRVDVTSRIINAVDQVELSVKTLSPPR